VSRLVVSTILNCFVYTAEKAEVLFLRKTKIYVKNALLLKWLFHYALQIFFDFFCHNIYVFSKFSEDLSRNVFTDFPTFIHCHERFFFFLAMITWCSPTSGLIKRP